MTLVHVEVSQEDVDLGVRFSPCECPVALALFRATGKTWLVKMRTGAERWRMPQQAITFPPEVVDFIGDFDASRPVKPFSFDVEVPT